MLSLYAVDKSFGRSKILKSIDLQLDKKTYGLLGPNGAGKTTLMRCITGLYPLSAGKIEFNGSDISKDKNFQSHIGYLPQKFGLYKELTAFEMMEMLADLKGISREKSAMRRKIYQTCRSSGQARQKSQDPFGRHDTQAGRGSGSARRAGYHYLRRADSWARPGRAPALQEYCFKARGRAHDNYLHAHCRGC